MSDHPGNGRPRYRWIGAFLALGFGLAIAWMDTRPGWDDTGITAGTIGIAGALAGFLGVPWALAAALVAGPILAAELPHGAGVLLAALFAVTGALLGSWVRRQDVRGQAHPL
jgi:hypothetical protein